MDAWRREVCGGSTTRSFQLCSLTPPADRPRYPCNSCTLPKGAGKVCGRLPTKTSHTFRETCLPESCSWARRGQLEGSPWRATDFALFSVDSQHSISCLLVWTFGVWLPTWHSQCVWLCFLSKCTVLAACLLENHVYLTRQEPLIRWSLSGTFTQERSLFTTCSRGLLDRPVYPMIIASHPACVTGTHLESLLSVYNEKFTTKSLQRMVSDEPLLRTNQANKRTRGSASSRPSMTWYQIRSYLAPCTNHTRFATAAQFYSLRLVLIREPSARVSCRILIWLIPSLPERWPWPQLPSDRSRDPEHQGLDSAGTAGGHTQAPLPIQRSQDPQGLPQTARER